MRRTLPSAILLGLLLATAGAGAEKLAAIRATTFRVTDPGVEGFAPAYPIGVPLLTQRSGFRGATVDWTLRFLEIQRVTSAPRVNSCTVSYPAGGKPPPAPPARGRPDSGSRVFGISGAASPADTD